MVFYKKKSNVKNQNLIKIFIIICFILFMGIWIFSTWIFGNNIKCKEGLELHEDHGEAGFTADEITLLKEKNESGLGFQILDYKTKNVADFYVEQSLGETEIKTYYDAKTEAGHKKLWEALNAHKNAQKKKITDAVNSMNKNATVGKYFKEINKNIKTLNTIIDEILLQMVGIYTTSNMIPLYTKFTELKPELNSITNSMYMSTKISKDMVIELSTFVTYLQTGFSNKLKLLHSELESLYSLSNENTSDKNKEFLDKLREFDTIINKIINAISMIKMEDISKLQEDIKNAWLIYNIDQMLDNEEIQPYKRQNYPNAKW
jgi:hypothetical protein